MTQLRAFVRLSRPLFLYGGFAGVALGAAVARRSGSSLDLQTYLWVQALVTAFQLMVHYANDYFDHAGDAGARRRTPWSGGSGVLHGDDVPARVALIAALVCGSLGLLASLRFALAGNAVVAWLGLAIFVFAWFYSAPPVRFAARGLGEPVTALVVAVLVPFAGYAAFAGRIGGAIENAVLAPAVAMIAMMFCVELPDAETDIGSGKRNLMIRLGPALTWRAIAVAALLAVAIAARTAYRLDGAAALAAIVPAAAAALVLVWHVVRDPRPASMAFWGVALYATTVTGLAIVYATPAPFR
ncbi:MAG TPA: prenyltransferase [Candidatus Elarobacter sp.]|nr:prenyltransferase [Candidatus Elarobacter sp.]